MERWISIWTSRCLESSIVSTVFQILSLIDKSGELSFPVIWLVLVGDPSLRTCRLRSYIQSSSSLPRASGGWIGSYKWECPLKSLMMIEFGVTLIIDASNLVTWVPMFGRSTLWRWNHWVFYVRVRSVCISSPASSADWSLSMVKSFRIKSSNPPPLSSFQSLQMVAKPSMKGVLCFFQSFDSFTAHVSIDEFIRMSRSSEILGAMPLALFLFFYSLFYVDTNFLFTNLQIVLWI